MADEPMLDVPDYYGVTFAIEDEDHTLANTLRFFLNKNPHVAFCGYSMPHPSEEVVNIRVQTTGLPVLFGVPIDPGEHTASQALRSACDNVQQVCTHMTSTFQAALAEFKATQ